MIDETLYIEFDTVRNKLIASGNALPTGQVLGFRYEDLEKIIYPTPERICPDRNMLEFYEHQANDKLALDYIYRMLAKYIPISLLTQDVVYIKDGVSYNDFIESWWSDIVDSYKIIITFNASEQSIHVLNPIHCTEDVFSIRPNMIYGFIQKIKDNDLAMYILRLISYMPGPEGVENGIWLNCKCQFNDKENNILELGTDNEGLIALGQKISAYYNNIEECEAEEVDDNWYYEDDEEEEPEIKINPNYPRSELVENYLKKFQEQNGESAEEIEQD